MRAQIRLPTLTKSEIQHFMQGQSFKKYVLYVLLTSFDNSLGSRLDHGSPNIVSSTKTGNVVPGKSQGNPRTKVSIQICLYAHFAPTAAARFCSYTRFLHTLAIARVGPGLHRLLCSNGSKSPQSCFALRDYESIHESAWTTLS